MKKLPLKLNLATSSKLIAQNIQLNPGSSLVGNSGSTLTQLLYWNGTNAYYGRKLTGMIGVSNHYFRIDGSTKMTISSSGKEKARES